MSKEYKYSNKGKVYTFNTSDLSDEELFKFNRMTDRQKQRFITVFNLNKHNDLTDEISLKTDKRAQNNDNDKLNKLSVVKRKKEELDNLIENSKISSSDEINNDLKELILSSTTYISPNDFKDGSTDVKKVSDLEQKYIKEISELNVENVENLNITNVKNLTMSVDDLIKKIKDPLQTALPLIINNLSDNQNILNAADRNNITELINILKNDSSKDAKEALSKLNNEIFQIKEAIEKLANTSVSTSEVIDLIQNNKTEIINILDENIQKIKQQVKIPLNVLKAIDISKLTKLEEGDLTADNVFNLLIDAGINLLKRITPKNKQELLLFAGDIGYKFYNEIEDGELQAYRLAISDDRWASEMSDGDKHSELSDYDQMKVFVLHCIADDLIKRGMGNSDYSKNESFMAFVDYIESLKKEDKLKQKAREILDDKYGGRINGKKEENKKKQSQTGNMNLYFNSSNNDLIAYLLFEILQLLRKSSNSLPEPSQLKNVSFDKSIPSKSLIPFDKSIPSKSSESSKIETPLVPPSTIPSIPPLVPPLEPPPKKDPQPKNVSETSIPPLVPPPLVTLEPPTEKDPQSEKLTFLDEIKNPHNLKPVKTSKPNPSVSEPPKTDIQKMDIAEQLKQQLDKMREDIAPEDFDVKDNEYNEDYYGEGLSKISYYDFIGML